MTAMRKIAILTGTLLLLTSCFKDIHELSALRHYNDGGEGEGGSGGGSGSGSKVEALLGTSLNWEIPDDAGTVIHSLTISVGGTNTPFTKAYKDAREASAELIPVAAGRNDILATVNMTDADGFIISGLPATKADAAVGDVVVSLKDPVSSPAQSWFAVTDTDIKKGEITRVEPVLQRLMPSITLDLANVPAGTNVVLTLSNVAKCVNITAKDSNGRWGLPSDDSEKDLQIADLTATSNGPLKLENFTLFPTASAFTRCMLTIDVTAASGNKTQCVCDAPHIESGKAYTLELDYNTLRPYMYLDSYSINPWEDGWTVNGEILNPVE